MSCSRCVPNSSIISCPIISVSADICCDRAMLSDVRPKISLPASRRDLCDCSWPWKYYSRTLVKYYCGMETIFSLRPLFTTTVWIFLSVPSSFGDLVLVSQSSCLDIKTMLLRITAHLLCLDSQHNSSSYPYMQYMYTQFKRTNIMKTLHCKIVELRRLLGKSFWSSCARFTFADLLTNT